VTIKSTTGSLRKSMVQHVPRRAAVRRAACRLGAGAALAAVMAVAMAADSGPAAAQQAMEFDIPAGPLPATLLRIAQLADTTMSFQPGLVRPHNAPAIRGRYTPLQAVTLALQPSGLVVDKLETGALAIRAGANGTEEAAPPPGAGTQDAVPAPAPTTQADFAPAAVLPRVVVTGSGRPPDADGLRALRGWSATRGDTPLADLPQAVSVLTPQALEQQGGATSTEALRYVPGVTEIVDFFGTGGRFMPSHQIRGFTASYALSGVGTARAIVPADNAFIERIEIPKGPSGVIAGFAGQGAAGVSEFGGVINLVRKQAGPDPQAQLTQSLDSADGGTLRFTGDVGGPWSGPWGGNHGWRLVGHASQSGRTEGGYERKQSAGVLGTANWQRGFFSAAATLQVDSHRGVPAPASRGGLRLLDGGGFAVVPLEDGVAEPLDPRDRLLARGTDLDLDLSWRLAPQWQLDWKTRAEVLQNDWRRSELLFFPVESTDRYRRGVTQVTLSGALSTGPARHRLSLGVDVQRSRVSVRARTPGGVIEVASDELRQALLLQDQVDLGRWKLRLAAQRAHVARLDIVQNGVPLALGTNSGLNGDAGLLFQWRPDVAFYAGLQSTIEAGQYLATDFVLADGSLRPPARMAQVQLGTRVNLMDRRMTLSAEAFRIRKLDRVIDDGSQRAAVAGRYVNGLELELAGRPAPAWDLSLGFALTRARDLNYVGNSVEDVQTFETRTAGIPIRALQLLSRWRLPDSVSRDTHLGIGLRATSSHLVGIPDNVIQLGVRAADYPLPGGAQLDLSLERGFGPWVLRGFVHNLTDQRIYSPAYEVTYLPLQPERHFGLSLSYKD
jgi:iron complex outermembrane receptor protein